MKKNIFLALLVFATIKLIAHDMPHNQVSVQIKITMSDNHKVTPAYVCIENAVTGEVVTPPYGKVVTQFSTVDDFVAGIRFSDDQNWIGPVRRTSGKGYGSDRSFEYEFAQPLPYWKANALYLTSGNFFINLKPGKWMISISRGFEYEPIVRQEFEINTKNHKNVLGFELKRWISMPEKGWYSGDVHVHHATTLKQHRDFLLQMAIAGDLHITNTLNMGYHHMYGDDKSGIDYEQQGFGKKFRTRKEKYWLVPGQEDPRGSYGHVIGLNINKFVRDTLRYDYYDLVFNEIQKQSGALVGFAHLAFNGCEFLRGFPWYITTGKIDFVELLQLTKINMPGYYDYLNLGFKLTAAAGSDLPWAATSGEVRTYVYTGKKFSPDAWFDGLKKGRTFVSNGPMVQFNCNGKLPGTEIDLKPNDEITLNVKAFGNKVVAPIASIEIYGSDGLIYEKINSENFDEVTVNHRIKVENSKWFVAVVKCKNNAIAHTSPVYCLVDKKPAINLQTGVKIIEKQMALINKTLQTASDTGIVRRLKDAQKFYNALSAEISKQGKTVTNTNTKSISILDKVFVKGGKFNMGDSTNDGDCPVHEVTVSDFYISSTEITNLQFVDFLNNAKVAADAKLAGKQLVYPQNDFSYLKYENNIWRVKKGYENYPVNNVSWWGADAYCKAAGGQLPTEAQWEYAAGGGNHNRHYIFSGSNEVDNVAWFANNSIDQPHLVATLQPNALGIYDMSGNVGEWCADNYAVYTTEIQVNPLIISEMPERIFRGGSYREVDSNSRITRRNAFFPDAAAPFIGFRIVFSEENK